MIVPATHGAQCRVVPQGDSAGDNRGLVPRLLEDMFERIAAAEDADFDVRVSFLEVYNECMFDLLSRAHAPPPPLSQPRSRASSWAHVVWWRPHRA